MNLFRSAIENIAIQKIEDVVTIIYGCILCSGEGKHENTMD